MEVRLGAEVAAFVQQQLDSGLFASPEEVISTALDVLCDHEERFAELYKQIESDVADSIACGEHTAGQIWDKESLRQLLLKERVSR